MEYEDGEETKSDFLARMILMGRVDIDEQNKYGTVLARCIF